MTSVRLPSVCPSVTLSPTRRLVKPLTKVGIYSFTIQRERVQKHRHFGPTIWVPWGEIKKLTICWTNRLGVGL